MAMIAGSQGGKGLSIATRIPTPSGYKIMGDIVVGDQVFGADGNPCNVTFVSEVHYRDTYRIEFDDGSFIIADDEHLWTVDSFDSRRNRMRGSKNPAVTSPKVLSTIQIKEITDNLKHGHRLSIAITEPVQYAEKDLPIPPYTFGAWLGDGSSKSSAICCSDEDHGIIERISEEWNQVKSRIVQDGKTPMYSLSVGKGNNSIFANKLKELEVFNNKHIPNIYLQASVNQRLNLLRGLMDTDGYCDPRGHLEFTSVNVRLAYQVLELLRSLGIKARISYGKATIGGRIIGDKYRVRFNDYGEFFTLKRKQERVHIPTKQNTRSLYIHAVKKIDNTLTKCIQVDSKDKLYLATESYIPTHNTSFGPWWLDREIQNLNGGDHLAVTASFDLFKLKMLPTMLNVYEHILGIGRYWTGDKIIEIKDPTTDKFLANKAGDHMWGRIILRSADALGGLESSTAKSAWLDECGQDRFTRGAYQAVRRRLAIYRGRILMTTTLYNMGWMVDTIIDKAVEHGTSVLGMVGNAEYEVVDNEQDNIFLIQFDSTVNPAFSDEEFEEQRQLLSDEDFNMFYRGRKAAYRSMIYSSFDRHLHTCVPFRIPDEWDRYMGLDFGGTHTAATFYAEHPETKVLYCYREYLQGKIDIEEHVKVLMQNEPQKPVCYGGAKSEDQWRMEFSKHGLTVYTPKLTSVDLGINRVFAQHKTNGIIYFNNLDGILNEKMKYRRKMDGNNNITSEIDNKNAFHLLDSERYIISEIRPGATLRAKVLNLGG